MALRNIVKNGDPILHKKSREVVKFDDRLHMLLDDMAETMYEAQGVGLAAVQVGVLRRVAIVDVDEELLEFINPQITYRSKERQCGPEGCLSFPGEAANVIRPLKVIVEAQDRHGTPFTYEATEFKARAIFHELDHLEGIVFHDVSATEDELEEWIVIDKDGNEVFRRETLPRAQQLQDKEPAK